MSEHSSLGPKPGRSAWDLARQVLGVRTEASGVEEAMTARCPGTQGTRVGRLTSQLPEGGRSPGPEHTPQEAVGFTLGHSVLEKLEAPQACPQVLLWGTDNMLAPWGCHSI